MTTLLTPAAYNPKTRKGLVYGYETGILHLAPHKASGFNVCPFASEGCIWSCLNTAGRGAMAIVQAARVRRTIQFFEAREQFFAELRADILRTIAKAAKTGRKAAIRLNGTSDLPWERISTGAADSIITEFPTVQFYDYTKNWKRVERFLRGELPANYMLVYSMSEAEGSRAKALELLALGGNVAMVFANALPDRYLGFQVVDGDAHDLRFQEQQPQGEPGVIVGLLAKGKGKHDDSGFVIHWQEEYSAAEVPSGDSETRREWTIKRRGARIATAYLQRDDSGTEAVSVLYPTLAGSFDEPTIGAALAHLNRA